MPATEVSSLTCNGDSPNAFNTNTGNPVMGDPVRITRLTTIQATAVATQDVTVTIPYGARITDITAIQVVTPTGATVTLQAGITVGGAELAPAQSVLAGVKTIMQPTLGAIVPLTTGSQRNGSTFTFRLTQTTPTAVGTLLVIISYLMA